MKRKLTLINCLVMIAVFFAVSSCKESSTGNGKDISKTLDPVENVSLIQGGENATLTVNLDQDKQAYFHIEFANIAPNDVIENGIREGWCIDFRAPLNHDNATYEGVKLYSTYLVEKWKPINYLLNKKEEMLKNDPDLTWRELQLAIWSLRESPAFNLREIDIADLPRAMRTTDGQAAFNYEKAEEVINFVEQQYKTFDFSNAKFVVVSEMPSDTQTLITVVE